ncbi:hypothetical protein PA6_060_00060 [Aquipseudomonas alcaligenes NBRC 14159]|jgi:hypothetical protein|uniref:Uncharacterized protein n=1 Tax=Aquipseudomonas alcaligenes (strain ATCC 14909 / DSM 50342 / CCUG 1425 / JCM 20561 / NBRC 14159 / NCIMB 9945 / NCTC 10367 / 1577) TaxID=1215092 RepID=U2ZB97_AQUA1|nr:hypothetical protein PA6_060_00060 [Pseudomonas alcaligenes NBRC 14159]
MPEMSFYDTQHVRKHHRSSYLSSPISGLDFPTKIRRPRLITDALGVCSPLPSSAGRELIWHTPDEG